MAGHTTHYNLIKPTSAERVAVGDINDNSDIIDGNLYKANERADQMADDYNASETYNTGDYVRRENYLYKCNTDNTTGTWDDTKWDRVKVMDEITQGGGGGSSTLAGLNDVDLSSPTDGQVLGYNGTTNKWENVTGGGGGGSSTFAGLNDVNVTGVQNGDIARYNSTTGKWTDSSDLTDLELTVADLQASVLGITDGHTILAPDGTAMPQEPDLQFASGYVEDDNVNGKTIYIEMIRISQANYDTLKANGQLKPGAKYFIYDAQPVAVNASNLPYSSTQSTKQAIDEKGTVARVRGRNGLTGDITTDGYIGTTVPRVQKDANVTPTVNAIIWEEYINNSNNTPTNAFYAIETICGSDVGYGVQVAYGITAQAAYYRVRSHGTWQSWIKLTP